MAWLPNRQYVENYKIQFCFSNPLDSQINLFFELHFTTYKQPGQTLPGTKHTVSTQLQNYILIYWNNKKWHWKEARSFWLFFSFPRWLASFTPWHPYFFQLQGRELRSFSGSFDDGRVSSGWSDSAHDKVILISCKGYCILTELNWMNTVRTSLGTRTNLFIHLHMHPIQQTLKACWIRCCAFNGFVFYYRRWT